MSELLIEYQRGRRTSESLRRSFPDGWRVDFGGQFMTEARLNDRVVLLDGHARLAQRSESGVSAISAAIETGPPLKVASSAGLRGEFVAAVASAETVLVLRDPVGVRPLYLTKTAGNVALSTSIPALLSLPWVSRDIDEKHMVEFLAGRQESRGSTFYSAISAVPAGTAVSISEGRVTSDSYHRWDFLEEPPHSFDETVDHVRSQFLRVCSPPWANETVSAELSGGLDSSSVVGALVENGSHPLVGRMVFDDDAADERQYSGAVIEHNSLEAISVGPWQPRPEELHDLMLSTAVPLPPPNTFMAQTLHIALRDAGCPIVATGLGGDDAFASAPVGTRAFDALRHRDSAQLRSFAARARAKPGRAWPQLIRPTVLEALGRPHRAPFAPWIEKDVLTKHQIGRSRPAAVTSRRANNARWDNITSGRLAGICESLAPFLASAGVRQWHPYLDIDFIECAYRAPASFASLDGNDRALQRAALGPFLPDMVRSRRSKAEFSASAKFVLDRCDLRSVADGPLVRQGFLNSANLQTLMTRFAGNEAGALIALSSAYATDQWLRFQGH